MTKATTRNNSRRPFPRPTVVVSSCLLGKPVRWDGTPVSCAFVQQLKPFVNVIPVCPEIAIGLGVPRDPIRLVSNGDSVRLVQPSSGRLLTRSMKSFARQFTESINDVDGFILKSRSPSCGLTNVKLFATAVGSKLVGRTVGSFAAEVLENSNGLPVADERMLETERHRDHFLTRLFAMAAFRTVARTGTVQGLNRFHHEHHLMLAAYNQTQLRILDRVVRDSAELGLKPSCVLYRTHLSLALKRPMRNRTILNRKGEPKNSLAATLTISEPFPAKLRYLPIS